MTMGNEGQLRGKVKEEGPSGVWKVEGMDTRHTNENTRFRHVELKIKMTWRINLVAGNKHCIARGLRSWQVLEVTEEGQTKRCGRVPSCTR